MLMVRACVFQTEQHNIGLKCWYDDQRNYRSQTAESDQKKGRYYQSYYE